MPSTDLSKRGNRGLADCNHAALRALFNCVFNDPVFTLEAGDKNDIQTTSAIEFMIDGVKYNKSTISDLNATLTASDDDSTSQAADTTAYYIFCLDSSGNVEVYKQEDDVAFYPAIPDNRAPFGAVKVVTVAVTFTVGTTDYDASGVTSTFTDIGHMPSAVV